MEGGSPPVWFQRSAPSSLDEKCPAVELDSAGDPAPRSLFFDWDRAATFPRWRSHQAKVHLRRGLFRKLLAVMNYVFCLDQINGFFRSLPMAAVQVGFVVVFSITCYNAFYEDPGVPEPWDTPVDKFVLVLWFVAATWIAIPSMMGQHLVSLPWWHLPGLAACGGLFVFVLYEFEEDILKFTSLVEGLVNSTLLLLMLVSVSHMVAIARWIAPRLKLWRNAYTLPSAILDEWYCLNYVSDLLRPVPGPPWCPRVVERSFDFVTLEWYTPSSHTGHVQSFEVLVRDEQDVGKNGEYKTVIKDIKELQEQSGGLFPCTGKADEPGATEEDSPASDDPEMPEECGNDPDKEDADTAEAQPEYLHFWQEFPEDLLGESAFAMQVHSPLTVPSPGHKVQCRVAGLEPGQAYSFKVRAITKLVNCLGDEWGGLPPMDDMFNGGGRVGRLSAGTESVKTLGFPKDDAKCCGMDAPTSELYVQPVEHPPPEPRAAFMRLRSFSTALDWSGHMHGLGYSEEETHQHLLAELADEESQPKPLKLDVVDRRSMLEMAEAFYYPQPETENPFCQLKLKYRLAFTPPKIRGTFVLGAVTLFFLVVSSLAFAKQELDKVQDKVDDSNYAYDNYTHMKNWINNDCNSSCQDELYTLSDGNFTTSRVNSLSNTIDDFHKYANDIYNPLKAGFSAAVWTAAPITTFMLPCTLLAYNKKVMELRVGRPTFHADPSLYEGYHNTCFYGAYMSFVALGYILIYVIVWLVTWTILFEPTRDAFWIPFVKWLVWWFIGWILDRIYLRSQLFQVLCVHGDFKNWINNPELYFFVDSALTCYYVPQQAAAAVYRTIYLWLFAIIACFRCDVDMMPHGGETYDTGFSCFNACMMMHERQRHPVISTFFHLLSMPSEPARVSKKARNRWRLALLLLRNPSLRVYRRSLPEDSEDAPLAVANPLCEDKELEGEHKGVGKIRQEMMARLAAQNDEATDYVGKDDTSPKESSPGDTNVDEIDNNADNNALRV